LSSLPPPFPTVSLPDGIIGHIKNHHHDLLTKPTSTLLSVRDDVGEQSDGGGGRAVGEETGLARQPNAVNDGSDYDDGNDDEDVNDEDVNDDEPLSLKPEIQA